MHRNYIVMLLLLPVVIGCRDLYSPSIKSSQLNILVVDGFADATDGSVTIKLSRAISLASKDSPPAETKAVVTLEEENGNTTTLAEVNEGDYEATGIVIDLAKRYRLNIKTTDNKSYQSDFVELKESPAIDTVTWEAASAGVTIYASTHDASNKTQYYQWTYEETWQYHSKYNSSIMIENGQVVMRPLDQSIYVCWGSQASSSILINSTVRLSSDVVSNFPLTVLPPGTTKLSTKYSILVQQRALTSDAYNYWDQLRKTTESLGGLFDPLPSQVTGNFHNVADATEPVLGYFSGGTVQEKRIFIGFYDLPRYLQYVNPSGDDCLFDSIPVKTIGNYPSSTLLVSSYGEGPDGYLSASYSCIDCRANGGTTTKPSFWP